MKSFLWKCPRCCAPANGHGNDPSECLNKPNAPQCSGFICECNEPSNVARAHGETLDNPCTKARCYHCGWEGTFPKLPKGMQAWEKKALAAGWTMPRDRQFELGIAEIDLGVGSQ